MSKVFRKIVVVMMIALVLPAVSKAQVAATTKYKCMIQMTNYLGEGAYIVVSIIGKDDSYQKTLYVLGSDKKWYPDVKEWHKAYKQKPTNISAITGASVAGGDRSVVTLEFDNAQINAGYKLRFEAAVEDKEYHVKDLEIPLTSDALAVKNDGKGYIRYVRFSAN